MPIWEMIPQWIIAGIALFGAVQSYRNRKTLNATREAVARVQDQTNGMSNRLETLARKEGKAEGVAETKAKRRPKQP